MNFLVVKHPEHVCNSIKSIVCSCVQDKEPDELQTGYFYIPPDTGEVFVAKQCDHCGKILPNDSIRYCPGCGKSVASSRPAKKSISQDPPAWMKQLETSLTSNRSNLPLRELNVTVWEEQETRTLASPGSGNDEVQADQQVADGLPTSPLLVASPPKTQRSISSTIQSFRHRCWQRGCCRRITDESLHGQRTPECANKSCIIFARI